MTKNINIYNQSNSEVDGKYLQASQQLQIDKQNHGLEYINLYIEDPEGDWLENWDWEDNLTDYIDAFYHNCNQKNYQFAFDSLTACDELLQQPKNYQKKLELYSYLVEVLELEDSKIENNQKVLELAKKTIDLTKSLVIQISKIGEYMREERSVDVEEARLNLRIEYIKKLLNKIHNGVIRKTWNFQYEFNDEHDIVKKGIASNGDFIATFSIHTSPVSDCNKYYFLSIQKGSNPKEYIAKGSITEIGSKEYEISTFYDDEFNLIEEYLEKIEAANWQTKLSDLDALPE